jgi:peptidoglycan/xylan/chitin deacetylase (PgdA/CDA1 family)
LSGVILMYHRVADLAIDPWGLAVSPRHFAEHLEVVRASSRPVALEDLDRALGTGHGPVVALTFDDGYADNLEHARPLLARHDVPATVFVATGALDSGREFWWDELEAVLLRGTLPRTLGLEVDGEIRTWDLGDAAADDGAEHAGWRADGDDTPTTRHAVYRALYPRLRCATHEARTKVVDALLAWSGRHPRRRASHRVLSAAEVAELGDGRLVDVGAHSVTHASLPDLPIPAQRREIAGSKARLEEIVGRPVTAFAYPHGSRDADTVRLVREAGFTHACAAEPGALGPGSDRLQLPRVAAGDWDGEELARRLRPWLAP